MDKSQINSRTIEVINTLLNKIPELTKAALADTLKVKPAKFSEILNGRMNAGTDLMALLCSKYSVSPEYILMGEGDIFKNKQSSKPISEHYDTNSDNKNNDNETIKQESPINILLSIIREKDNKLQEQAEEIGRLRERVEQLECTKETKERPVSGVQSSGLADVG